MCQSSGETGISLYALSKSSFVNRACFPAASSFWLKMAGELIVSFCSVSVSMASLKEMFLGAERFKMGLILSFSSLAIN